MWRVFAFVLFLVTGAASAQIATDVLRPFSIFVDRAFGVYLGDGIVLTAAHISDPSGHNRVKIGGFELPATSIRRDTTLDIDVLLVDEPVPEPLGSRHLSLCEKPLRAGDPVLVSQGHQMVYSDILSTKEQPFNVPEKMRSALIRYTNEGVSGSGVFDPKGRCLVGIIIQQLTATQISRVGGREIKQPVNLAKHFVPAAEIAAIMPPGLRK